MYKQCFELLTAQGKGIPHPTSHLISPNLLIFVIGPKPHKSFSVSQGASEVTKEYDSEIKGNIFSLQNQHI